MLNDFEIAFVFIIINSKTIVPYIDKTDIVNGHPQVAKV